MRRMKFLGLLMIVGLISCSTTKEETTCLVGQACFQENINTFEIEEDAVIIIGGLPELYGSKLIALWDEQFPEYAGLLQASYHHDHTNAIAAPYAQYDIVFTYEELSGAYQSQLLPLHEKLLQEIYPGSYQTEKTWKDLFARDGAKVNVDKNKDTNVDKTDAGGINSDDNIGNSYYNDEELVMHAIQPYYVPVAYEGASFFYNKTMLEAIGVDVSTDINKDDMPDSIESWENIFALADSWDSKRPVYKKKPVTIVFPFSLNESYLSYFMFSSNGFRLFPDHDGMNPGFQSDEFLHALQFITEASKHNMAQFDKTNKYTAKDYTWQWEKVFTHQIAPFGIVAPWMDLTGAAKANKVEYVVTPYFPTFQSTAMKPFVTTLGYVLRANSKFPSAAHVVMQFLRSEAAMQEMIDASTFVPYRVNGHELLFDTHPNREFMQRTLASGDSMPLIAMPNNVYKSALDGYLEINVMEVIRRLWDGLIDPSQARSELHFLYQQWFFDNTKIRIPQ